VFDSGADHAVSGESQARVQRPTDISAYRSEAPDQSSASDRECATTGVTKCVLEVRPKGQLPGCRQLYMMMDLSPGVLFTPGGIRRDGLFRYARVGRERQFPR